MGTGWRRAFCTSIPRDPETTVTEKDQNPSPRSCTKFGFFNGGNSNPSTPRLQSQPVSSPSLRCRTTSSVPTAPSAHDSPRIKSAHNSPRIRSPRLFQSSNPSSPRSPSRFSLFKASLRLSKSNCGICLQSMKTGQGSAIFTAECSHAFHFPCIASHVRKNGTLVCPVCHANWREVPLLAFHKNQPDSEEDKRTESSPRDVKIKQEDQSKRSDQRVYDDDEPLLSPTAVARFNPIPEVDEDGDEEEIEEEFQGFFVNPNPSSSSSSSSIKSDKQSDVINGGDLRTSRDVEVRLLPVAAVVSVGRNHETYAVALKVKAPPPPAQNRTIGPLLDSARRAPIDLVAVLDVSGSMVGAKLQMLKRAMRLVVSSLGSADRISIIAFSANPKRLLPLTRMTAQGQRSARRIIDRLVCSQGTSVSDALRKATKVLEDRRDRNPVASIMLLSDGQDERTSSNSANQRRQTSNSSSTRFAHLEIPVHAFGFGKNGGHSHEPAEDAFAKCVGGLLSVVVKDLRLQLGFSSGSAPAEITAVYCCTGRPTAVGSSSVRLGDLYAEEERELLVELRVPTAPVGAHHVMTLRCCYKDPTVQEIIFSKEQTLLIPRPHAFRSSDPKIERLRNLFLTTRAVAEARLLVEHNDLSRAHHVLSSARALLLQSNTIFSDEYLRGLEAELKELHWRRQHHEQQQQLQQIQGRRTSEREAVFLDENGEPLTPTSAWRAAEQLAKVAIMRKSMNKVSDLHGFENARF